MRLVTQQVYRAFPELDDFSDEQCQRYVDRVAKSPRYLLAMLLSLLASIGVGVLVAITLIKIMVEILQGGLGWRSDMSADLFLIMGVLAVLVLPAISGLRVRDHVLCWFLRSHVGKARCLNCDYSLLGQRIIDGKITCPECGNATTLAALGLQSPHELIPPSDGLSAHQRNAGVEPRG